MMTRVFTSRTGAAALAIVLASPPRRLWWCTAEPRSGLKARTARSPCSSRRARSRSSRREPGGRRKHVPRRQGPPAALADGAITNPDQLKGLVARNDVYPGEQLTTNQFQKSDTTSVAVKLQPDQRAIEFPVDPASGLIGQLQSGDHVDVVATFDVLPVGQNGLPLTGAQSIPLTRTIVSNALVLTAPEANDDQPWRLGPRPVAHPGHRCPAT